MARVATRSPVTPGVVEWAVNQDGRAVKDIARAAGVEASELRAWLQGQQLPTVGQVTNLAEVLQRPRALFFLPAPPTGATLPVGFRRPLGDPKSRVSDAVLRKARQARRIQLAVAAISEHEPAIPKLTTETPPDRAASTARKWLNPDYQPITKPLSVLYHWRDLLDARGVLVFELWLGKGEVQGFASFHNAAPLVVLNMNAGSPSARLYTLAHELAHLTLRQETACQVVDDLKHSSSLERWCERFAAALLMPADVVRGLLPDVRPHEAGLVEVRHLGATLGVSGRAAAARLSDLDLAQPSLYAQVLALFQSKATTGNSSGGHSPPRPQRRVAEYGSNTVTRIIHELPPADALSILKVNVPEAREIAELVGHAGPL